MKLYVWEGVLTDYTDGIMFALANSVDEARELVYTKANGSSKPITWAEALAENEAFKANGYHGMSLVNDLSGEPKVVESPSGFFVYGGS